MRHTEIIALHGETYHARIGLQIEVISLDDFADDALKCITDIRGLLGPQVVHRDVDERGLRMDDIFDSACSRNLFVDSSLDTTHT